jgi:enoyl-CoA hydratase/carnithine racemase
MELETALYLALTGTRLSTPADLIAVGLATHFVQSEDISSLRKELLEADFSHSDPEAAIKSAPLGVSCADSP